MIRTSKFSEDGKYRYSLTRHWDIGNGLPVAMCIGLNPSNAGSKNDQGEERDDPTINILINALKWHGFGGFIMCNLYALVSPVPSKLFSVPDAQGNNDAEVIEASKEVNQVIFCWGTFKNIEYRAKKMIALFPDAKCFGFTSNGSPWHPRALHYGGIAHHETTLHPFRKK